MAMKARNQIVKIPFKSMQTLSASAGSAVCQVYPGAFARVLEIADAFDEYRVTSLRYRIHPMSTSRVNIHTLAYYPGVTDTPPATFTAGAENTFSTVLAIATTVPSEWKNVPRAILQGYFQWYKTVVGSVDTSEEVQGNLYATSGTTEAITIEVEGVFEFKGPAGTGTTPMLKRDAKVNRERERILFILSGGGSKDKTPSAGKPLASSLLSG